MAAPMSSVWMWQFHSPSPPTTTMESPSPAQTSLNDGDGVVGGLEEVHDLVAEPGQGALGGLGLVGSRTWPVLPYPEPRG